MRIDATVLFAEAWGWGGSRTPKGHLQEKTRGGRMNHLRSEQDDFKTILSVCMTTKISKREDRTDGGLGCLRTRRAPTDTLPRLSVPVQNHLGR